MSAILVEDDEGVDRPAGLGAARIGPETADLRDAPRPGARAAAGRLAADENPGHRASPCPPERRIPGAARRFGFDGPRPRRARGPLLRTGPPDRPDGSPETRAPAAVLVPAACPLMIRAPMTPASAYGDGLRARSVEPPPGNPQDAPGPPPDASSRPRWMRPGGGRRISTQPGPAVSARSGSGRPRAPWRAPPRRPPRRPRPTRSGRAGAPAHARAPRTRARRE